uniref:Ubiquitin carboxyl-terminal hydrolase 47 n=1 Tax=Diabrotica virgifera virgifera TaxID=50390 RepID=A0A6P7GLW5_DIAVI
MVFLPEDGLTKKVTVRDTIQQSEKKQTFINIFPSKTIDSIFREVSKEFSYNHDEIELVLQIGKKDMHILNDHKDKTVQEAGIKWTPLDRPSIIISTLKNKPMSLFVQESEDDLLLGASASPTAGEVSSSTCESGQATTNYCDFYKPSSRPSLKPIIIESTNYVGLVNQAMTCYLNSLLQALYMTPEFRNALYNWEFDGVNESRSIPYQLQKLFLNLQTSSKSAVETTDLTTSFGWQNSDAWHQHDIQELCRVMFDALEQKFKDTKQANLINDLYEGKMLDYVKCLECGTEKSREDTFLDIPLPVRPFGNAVAYNSVEEALRAFVQPETLDGNNQYHCEKCNKKCDAHKGLKFTKFPYLLTLHLKRFDFDYTTMHRIKLNDKVVFSEKLNLNSFIVTPRSENETVEDRENVVKCDDCSTTDSGSADDESCQGTDVSSTANGQDDNCADSDEGIDVSSGNNHDDEAKGPYMYELFSIMIHSGSASGGHYYAYIKDFDKNLWYCFNDQSVTGITEEDIRKTYGGGPHRGYYSGAYSSSTNAYMLMYRQIDKDRNARAMGFDDFPPHIKQLLADMLRKEEEDRINREKENEMMRISVFCDNPRSNTLSEIKLHVFYDSSLEEAAKEAYQRFNLNSTQVNLGDCRLVMYNRKHECIDSSFESDEIKFCDIVNRMKNYVSQFTEWMLEIKEPGTSWKVYQPGGINMKVYPIILETEEVSEPKLVRVDLNDTVFGLKHKIGQLLNMNPSKVKIVMEMYCNEPKYLDNDTDPVKFDPNCSNYKLYVSNALDEDPEKTFLFSKLKRLISLFGYIISLTIVLPDTDVATLESMSIPSLDLNQNLDKLELGSGDRCTNSPNLRVSPQPGHGDGFGDQSNSEDSSLSDSDRTLVGETPGDHIGMLSSSPTSPADQHMSSPSDPREDTYSYEALGHPGEEMNWDDVDTQQEEQYSQNYYFKITSETHNSETQNLDNNVTRCCKILADKRMTLERLKKNLEVVLRVPSEYFKVYKQYANTEDEWVCLSDTLRSARDGERITIKLGRVLRKDELKCNVYHLKLDNMDVNNFLFEHIIVKGQTVSLVKREILLQAKKQHMLDIPYHKCRLREKSWKKPKRVYLDDQRFDKDIIVISSNVDVFLQELSDTDPVTTREQCVLFVRQWCPSTLTLQPFQEVVLDHLTMEDLKKKLSELSGLPTEHIEVAIIKQPLPCDINVLDMESHKWHLQTTNLEEWPVSAENGTVFFYRDNRETMKELTSEERKELAQKENSRLRKLNLSSYSPGGERALKIYLDTSPSKSEDNCID